MTRAARRRKRVSKHFGRSALVGESIGAALANLASQDLTYRLSSEMPDAYRELQADFNEAIERLEGVMQHVSGTASAIHSGTQEIAAAADDLSQRTEQQAASLEETAAALHEITATVVCSLSAVNPPGSSSTRSRRLPLTSNGGGNVGSIRDVAESPRFGWTPIGFRRVRHLMNDGVRGLDHSDPL